MYIKRHIEKLVSKFMEQFPAILLTGPRQVGKSTMLKNAFPNIKYQTLDDIITLQNIKEDALGFFDYQKTPLILDEVQRVPDCFVSLKYYIDKNRKNGMYILTGSQKYQLMKNVSESLVGRIGIINMLGLSNREIENDEFCEPFLPSSEYFSVRSPKFEIDINCLWKKIHKGSMPEMWANEQQDWEIFYSSYVQTYISRDINDLAQVGDKVAFSRFMTSLASRTGELLNISSLASDVGIDQRTAKKWLSILQVSNVVYLLQPFSLNITKRVVKTPKVYFTDTGLVCYLCRWLTPQTLQNGAMAGAIFETYVINEILKSYYNAGKEPNFYFFRNDKQQEIDLIIYENGTMYPIEIKKTSSPNQKDIKTFEILQKTFPSQNIGTGGIICTYNQLNYLNKTNQIIPINYI